MLSAMMHSPQTQNSRHWYVDQPSASFISATERCVADCESTRESVADRGSLAEPSATPSSSFVAPGRCMARRSARARRWRQRNTLAHTVKHVKHGSLVTKRRKGRF
jgi:hypothetical protein